MLLQEVFDIVVLAATGKIRNDSYYRAIKSNVEDIQDMLKHQLSGHSLQKKFMVQEHEGKDAKEDAKKKRK